MYGNGSVDVTTLQGEDLGQVNMNKLKPYQELESTQAYVLQILACHILKAEIRAKKNHLHERNNPTQPQNTAFSHHNGETILPIEPNPYPDQETLKTEDLEVHQVMLEGYWVQPSLLGNNGWQLQNHEVPNSPRGSNFSLARRANCEPLEKLKQIHEGSIKVQTFQEKANPTPPRLKRGRVEQTTK